MNNHIKSETETERKLDEDGGGSLSVTGLVRSIDLFLQELNNGTALTGMSEVIATSPVACNDQFCHHPPSTIRSIVSEDIQFSKSPSEKSNFICDDDRNFNSNTSKDNGSHIVAKQHERAFVQHNYHDYAVSEALECIRGSNEDESNSSSEQEIQANQICRILEIGQPSVQKEVPQKAKRRSKTPPGPTFPQILHRLLDASYEDGYDSIVSWQPHGRAFRVHDTHKFVHNVMPKYFHQKKLTSFQRQLALYGFVRLTRKGLDFGSYYHERFLRGHSHLSCTIRRTPIKGTWIQKLPSPQTEPDFYTMAPVGLSATASACAKRETIDLIHSPFITTKSMVSVTDELKKTLNTTISTPNGVKQIYGDDANHSRKQNEELFNHEELLHSTDTVNHSSFLCLDWKPMILEDVHENQSLQHQVHVEKIDQQRSFFTSASTSLVSPPPSVTAIDYRLDPRSMNTDNEDDINNESMAVFLFDIDLDE